jgi:hypothetical protein
MIACGGNGYARRRANTANESKDIQDERASMGNAIDHLRRRVEKIESMPQAQEQRPVQIVIFSDRPLKANEIYYKDAIQQVRAKGNQDGQRD